MHGHTYTGVGGVGGASLTYPGLFYMGIIGQAHCLTSSCVGCSPKCDPIRLQIYYDIV